MRASSKLRRCCSGASDHLLRPDLPLRVDGQSSGERFECREGERVRERGARGRGEECLGETMRYAAEREMHTRETRGRGREQRCFGRERQMCFGSERENRGSKREKKEKN